MATLTRKELADLGWREKDGKAVRIVPTEAIKPREKIDGKFDSKLERDYATHLSYLFRAGEVKNWIHHPPPIGITRANRYTPDFLVYTSVGGFEYVEVKGHIREDDTLKCQMVKDLCPAISVVMVRRIKGSWVRREF